MPDLILTSAEALHIAYTIDAQEDYPIGTMMAGGEDFRRQFLEIVREGHDGPHMLAMSRGELWLLDTKLLRPDPRGVKMPDGTPVLDLLTKVWDAIIESYAERGGGHAADRDDHHDASTHHGAADATALRA